jgi:hypothetical protein
VVKNIRSWLFIWRCAALGIGAEILLLSAKREKQKIAAESPTPRQRSWRWGSAQNIMFVVK